MGGTWLTGEDGERILTLHPYAEVYAPRWDEHEWTWFVNDNCEIVATGKCNRRSEARRAAVAALRAYEEENHA